VGATLERRSVRGAIAAGIGVAVSVGQNIVLLPILLHQWGKARYAAWISISAVSAVILSIDAGHHNYVGAEFNKIAVDPKLVRQTLASALQVAAIIGLLEIVIAAAVGLLHLTSSLSGVDAAVATETRLALTLFVLVGMSVLPFTMGGILNRLYAPAGYFEEAQWWNIAARVVQTAAIALTAGFGGGILLAAFTSSAAVFAVMLASVTSLRRLFAQFWPFWVGGSLRLGFRNLARSLVLTATQWLLQFQSNWLIIIVATTLGDSALAVFATLRTIANAFIQGIQVLFLPLAPDAIRFALTAEHKKLRELLCASWLVGGTVINIALLASVPVLEPLYQAWTRGVLRFEPRLFFALAVAVAMRAVGAPLLNLLAGTNELRAQALIALAQATTVAATALLMLRNYGVVAAGWAVAAGEAIGSVALPAVVVAKRLRERDGQFPARPFAIALVSLACLMATFTALLYSPHPAPPLLTGLACIVACQWALWRELDSSTQMRLRGMLRLGRGLGGSTP